MSSVFDQIIKKRRSVRVFLDKNLDDSKVKKAIENATLAPNSSNMQLWEFYHVTNSELKTKISKYCFDQPAAKTANQFVVVVTRKDLWQIRRDANLNFVQSRDISKKGERSKKGKETVIKYYKYLIPTLYGGYFSLIGLIKYLNVSLIGLFRPIYRQVKHSDMRVVVHKSAALAAQNFMLSMVAYGYDTCPMEGFDSLRVKKVLKLPSNTEINMILGCGIRSPKGIYSEQFRVPFEKVYFKV